MGSFTSQEIKLIFEDIKDKKEIEIRGQKIEILSIKEANAGYDYAKVKIKIDGWEKYLELYWDECLYFGVDLSEDINEFANLDDKNLPNPLIRNNKKYYLADDGTATVTEAKNIGDYHKGDKVYFWEYFSADKRFRISLGFHQRLQKWLNMYAEKLTPEEIKVIL